MFWKWNIRYSKSVALTPFHKYIQYNQIETLHYYNAYAVGRIQRHQGRQTP